MKKFLKDLFEVMAVCLLGCAALALVFTAFVSVLAFVVGFYHFLYDKIW